MLFAIYLHYDKGIEYSDFYNSFIKFMLCNTETVGGRVYTKLKERFDAVTEGNAGLVWEDRRFGDVGWPSEEFVFLNIAIEAETFYSEVHEFLSQYFDDKELFEDLFEYQKKVVKFPFKDRIEIENKYDFKAYFSDILCGTPTVLNKKNCLNVIASPVKCNTWKDYARYIIWYGRKDSRNIYLDEIKVQETEKKK